MLTSYYLLLSSFLHIYTVTCISLVNYTINSTQSAPEKNDFAFITFKMLGEQDFAKLVMTNDELTMVLSRWQADSEDWGGKREDMTFFLDFF